MGHGSVSLGKSARKTLSPGSQERGVRHWLEAQCLAALVSWGPDMRDLSTAQKPGQESEGEGKAEVRCFEFGQGETKTEWGLDEAEAGGIVTRIPPIYKTSRETYRAGVPKIWKQHSL